MASLSVKKKELLEKLKRQGINDKGVIAAMSKVKREEFVTKEFAGLAYEDAALHLFEGQTISQPYTVAFMLKLLELNKGLSVLEVGSGSGYNAALMAEIVKPGKVYTTEVRKPLFEFASKNIKTYKNVSIAQKDGSKGWKEHAPFDRMILTAACEEIPKVLFQELSENGVLVAPVGSSEYQVMKKITKKKGKLLYEDHGFFSFVPLKT